MGEVPLYLSSSERELDDSRHSRHAFTPIKALSDQDLAWIDTAKALSKLALSNKDLATRGRLRSSFLLSFSVLRDQICTAIKLIT